MLATRFLSSRLGSLVAWFSIECVGSPCYNWSRVYSDSRRILGLESIELARKAVDIASDKLASNILLLDIRPVSILADYFVISTATSERQTKAIVDDLLQELHKDGIDPLHQEGTSDSGWVLIDFGPVIVHIFSPEERAYYAIEKLWKDAVTVLHLM